MSKIEHDLRHKALLAALMGNHSNLNADAIVERAKAFEQYLSLIHISEPTRPY